MSGKIITRVRERQELAQRNARLRASRESKQAMYSSLLAAAHADFQSREMRGDEIFVQLHQNAVNAPFWQRLLGTWIGN